MGLDPLELFEPQASVLGALLLEPQRMGEAALSLCDEDFPDARCRTVWQAMKKLFRAGGVIDPVTVRDALTGYDGATALLISCMEAAPNAGGFQQHLAALKRQARMSSLRELGTALSTVTDPEEADALVAQLNRLAVRRQARERRSMAQMLQSFASRHAADQEPVYLPWGMAALDAGLHIRGGKYVILGGYPSDGKTALALNFSMAQAERCYRVRFYSLETDCATVEDRLLAAQAGISLENIQHNRLSPAEWESYAALSRLAEADVEIVNAAGMTVDDIRADALACRADVIYVDYLGLINPGRSGGRYSTRYEDITNISMQLQQLAKTTGITVVALCQLSRPAGGAPPDMHSLRESGQIEQDADAILLLYRDDPKDIRSLRNLVVAKNKEGRTGRFKLDFDGLHQRFTDRVSPERLAGIESRHSHRRPYEPPAPAGDADQQRMAGMEEQ